MPRLLRHAGIADVAINYPVHVYPPGHGRRIILPDFAENLSGPLLDEGFVGAVEMTELKKALGQHLAADDTVVVSHLFLQAWGRKVVSHPGEARCSDSEVARSRSPDIWSAGSRLAISPNHPKYGDAVPPSPLR